MAENVHYDTCRNALRQQQRCAAVPKIVESPAGNTCAREQFLESVGDNAAAQRIAVRATEHKVGVLPPERRAFPLAVLNVLVVTQPAYHRSRQSQGAAAAGRLQMDQLVLVVDPLQLPG